MDHHRIFEDHEPQEEDLSSLAAFFGVPLNTEAVEPLPPGAELYARAEQDESRKIPALEVTHLWAGDSWTVNHFIQGEVWINIYGKQAVHDDSRNDKDAEQEVCEDGLRD